MKLLPTDQTTLIEFEQMRKKLVALCRQNMMYAIRPVITRACDTFVISTHPKARETANPRKTGVHILITSLNTRSCISATASVGY
jgi:hypothetical protein